MSMVNFGFSAFLKLVSQNEKPQKTTIKGRLEPPSGKGYDFHKSLRDHARRYLVDGEPMTEVIATASKITALPERLSVIVALKRLEGWREVAPGNILSFGTAVFQSPRTLFSVKFEPNFGLNFRGRATAFHIWNTKQPKLARGPTYAALELAAEAFRDKEDGPEDFAVLSLREPVEVFLLRDMPAASNFSGRLVQQIESLIQGPPTLPQQREDRPTI